MPIVKLLKITGRVQGVGFRHHMSRAARRLGVTGWVRNLRDGSVEAMVSGSSDSVAKIIDWARHGPASAVVADVEISEATGSYTSFDTLPTD